MNRDLLKKKLREKIENKKGCRLSNNAKKHNEESKLLKLNNDPRITDDMKRLYRCLITELPELKVGPPNILLDNLESTKQEFEAYLVNIIKISKKNNIIPEDFIKLFNNTYTKYMVSICGIEIIPEKLRFIFSS